ncbi:cupin domain-containing protein [Peribacillus glennii]|uniref:Cupin domain-containing protein n=1 Tax=Peribacillus glennii TaxID=2303991 RepID=A0A372LEW5_9BACI|nr:cupin domain-containing protein [Peribacillus glennii]RFU63840.1 cupin domain-containing protein [Peribacillus glennii]
MTEVKSFYLEDDGIIPNNPNLPVIFYPAALKGKGSQAEDIFHENNWGNSWMDGIFDFHHYHSNAHEALAVVKGTATVQIGGSNGKELQLSEGDVVVLPAGTGHKRIDSSPDFKVAGAYPDGKEYNTKTANGEDRLIALEDIKKVPLPKYDPLFGTEGPLLKLWKNTGV